MADPAPFPKDTAMFKELLDVLGDPKAEPQALDPVVAMFAPRAKDRGLLWSHLRLF
jgi:hypothetical protein